MQIKTLESFKSAASPCCQPNLGGGSCGEAASTSAAGCAGGGGVNESSEVNVKELLFVSKRVEKVTVAGINRPKVPFRDTAQLPPGWAKFTDPSGEVCYISPDGERCKTLALAFKYLEKQRALKN